MEKKRGIKRPDGLVSKTRMPRGTEKVVALSAQGGTVILRPN